MISPFSNYQRIALGTIGILYTLLGTLCSLSPLKIGKALGYSFKGNGIVEFVVLYGGMEFGLGAGMLVATFNKKLFPGAYFMALVVSLCLPLARIGMHLASNIKGHGGFMLVVETLVFAALVMPCLRRTRQKGDQLAVRSS